MTRLGLWIRISGDSVDPSNPQGNSQFENRNAEVFRDVERNTARGTAYFAPKSLNLIDVNLTAELTRNPVDDDKTVMDRIISREIENIGVSLDNRSTLSFGPQNEVTVPMANSSAMKRSAWTTRQLK